MAKEVNLLIVSGMSGAGKTCAMRVLEDLGYFCIDNYPISLVDKLLDIAEKETLDITKVAIAVDIRSREFWKKLTATLRNLKQDGVQYEIVFLDANDKVLVNRYKESRRKHPLQNKNSILDAIAEERKIISVIRDIADKIIDTSEMNLGDFKRMMQNWYGKGSEESIGLTFYSFGFKYGIPLDADIVLDVRFMTNPYYIAELKPLCGLDKPVKDYVLELDKTRTFLEKTEDLLKFLIPEYINEGKSQLVVAIGCTGGQHRSVAIAEYLAERFKDVDLKPLLIHRDMEKNMGK